MPSTWRSRTNEQALEILNDKIDTLREVSYVFSQPINQGGQAFGTGGKGSPAGGFGNSSANQIFNPLTSSHNPNVTPSITKVTNPSVPVSVTVTLESN